MFIHIPTESRSYVKQCSVMVAILDYPLIQTRGSKEHVIAHLVFNLTSKVEIENGGVTHNFESGPPKIISTQISEQKILIWFLSHNIPKWNKLAEKNLTEKPRIYVKLLIAM